MTKYYQMYIDEDGFPRARFPEPPQKRSLIGLFLMMDIGSNIKGCEELIRNVIKVSNGDQEMFEATGNLFTILISKDQTTISNAFEDENDSESYTFSTFELLEVLRDWHELLLRS